MLKKNQNNSIIPEKANYTIGLSYAKSGEFEKAISILTSVISNNPEYSDAYQKRAASYLGINDRESAYAGFNEAIQLNKNDYISMRWKLETRTRDVISKTEITELFNKEKI
jgi:tetratricopeptide (TPR) repeat protein